MLIINADDWGRSAAETNAASDCYKRSGITSVSAMTFMKDSERAAELAKAGAVDVGLHINFTEAFTGAVPSSRLQEYQGRVSRFLKRNSYAFLVYHPFLREEFRYLYQAQADEFVRLYGDRPSHIDGHQHMHLCTNVLADQIIPRDQKIRTTFSFSREEKSWLNRKYRHVFGQWLAHRYRTTDYLFDLSQCLEDRNRLSRALTLAKAVKVEMMAHPVRQKEYTFLTSEESEKLLSQIEKTTYAFV
jgi:chitin disaccharide deacetylase